MRRKLINFFAVTLFSTPIFAQQSFTIDEALKYAVEHNVNVQKAKIDQTIADQKVKETIGIGLPQINGQVKYNYLLDKPTTLFPVAMLPDRIFNQIPGLKSLTPDEQFNTFFPFKGGYNQSMTAGVTLSQLLFNGSYIVGLESSKTYKETAALVEEKTEVSISEAVLSAYAGILATQENIKTLEENKKVLSKNLEDTKVIYKTGLTELQNVEQLEYSYKNLSTVIENLKRTEGKLTDVLKYLIGFPLEQKIILSSTFDEVLQKNKTLISKEDYDPSKHIDIRLKQNQIRISELLLKLEKSKALPSLSLSLFDNTTANNNTFYFINSKQQWFNMAGLGVQLDVPIFSGFQRHWKTQQAKLNLEKAKLDKEDAEKQLKSDYLQKSSDYESALASFDTAEELIKLSQEIYRKQQIKFKEGMGTSFELSQAESQLYDSQTKYYQAAIELIQAKIKLDKALGKL